MAMVSLGCNSSDADPVEQGFIRDICLHPEDDGLRLIFADWLSDNGQEDRAEFIRTQMELEELKKVKGKSMGATLAGFPVRVMPPGHIGRQLELERRERELLMRDIQPYPYHNFFRWLRTGTGWDCFRDGEPNPGFGWFFPAPLVGGECPKCFVKFRRGFVEEITLPCLAFLEHAREIFSHHPVRKVKWEDTCPYTRMLDEEEEVDEGEIPAWCRWDPLEREREHKDDIPGEIWDLLVGKGRKDEFPRQGGGLPWCWYPDTPHKSPLMVEDLSQACVKWGRRRAGLGA